MPNEKGPIAHQAYLLWQKGQSLDAGRLIFEKLPLQTRPIWAAKILKIVIEKAGIVDSSFRRILKIADNPDLWKDAHAAFSEIRREVLKLDKLRQNGLSAEQDTFCCILSLAELVAKVTYNATEPSDEFDEDSGWWIVPSLRAFGDSWKDAEFLEKAWNTVVLYAEDS